jgi:hypothetical protein
MDAQCLVKDSKESVTPRLPGRLFPGETGCSVFGRQSGRQDSQRREREAREDARDDVGVSFGCCCGRELR